MNKPKSILRLDASPYQESSFFREEEEICKDLGLSYQFLDFRNEGIPKSLLEGPYILISNTHTPVDKLPKEILDQTSLWLHPNSGYDNFPKNWIKEQAFPILLGNSVRAPAVSEYILSCLFHHFSSVPHQENWSKERTWNRLLLRDQNVLILGRGMIGRMVEASLSPLVSSLTFYDPYQEGYKENPFERPAPHNVLILAASLNENNHHLINKETLGSLPSDVTIINAARGELINQKDLIGFLNQNPKAHAFLDVFEKEPFEGSPFKGIKNLNCTSHIAGVSKTLQKRILSFERSALKQFLEDGIQNFSKSYTTELLHNRIVDNQLI